MVPLLRNALAAMGCGECVPRQGLRPPQIGILMLPYREIHKEFTGSLLNMIFKVTLQCIRSDHLDILVEIPSNFLVVNKRSYIGAGGNSITAPGDNCAPEGG